MQELIGAVVGNYRIESLIDEGGMGRVYRARHLHLNRLAAIKIMLPELESVPGYRARFLQEARAAAALRHPNVVEIYEFGDHGGKFYLVMEYVADGNLLNLLRGQKQRTDQKPLSLALGLDLVRQAAIGLDYAHKRGMVHRDVKPANLLLEASADELHAYTLKVSDFGLARLREGGIETTIGKVRGTLAYMSPEQCQGLDLDGRADLYSLGIILFELATGRRPFEIKSPADALYKHIYAQPASPRSFRPELPAELESIILRCLAKDPNQRFPSCADLAANLQSLVKRGVLVEDSTQNSVQAPDQPEVSTSLHSLPLGTIAEPTELPEGEGGGEQAGGTPVDDETAQKARPSFPGVRVLGASGQTLSLLDLTGDGLTVGRLADNDFALEGEGISRHHLRIDWDGSEASVTDLGSRNGTFRQNGTRLAPGVKHRWGPRESFRVGGCWLRLESIAEARTAVEAPPGTVVEGTGEATPAIEPTLNAAAQTVVREVRPAKPGEEATAAGLTRGETRAPAVGPIELALEPVQLRLSLGQPATLAVRLRNLGTSPERLGVVVEGVSEGWVRHAGERVLVGPGEEASLELEVLVPQAPASRAGDYPIIVRATSATGRSRGKVGEQAIAAGHSDQATIAEEWDRLPFTASGRWTVNALVKHSLTLLPERLAALRIAEYQVRLENEGNSSSTLELSVGETKPAARGSATGNGNGGVGGAAMETLAYELSQPSVSLEPGEAAEVRLRVKGPTQLVGSERTHPFEVRARASEGGPPITAKAELVLRALLPLWSVLAASVLLAIGTISVLAFSLANPPLPTPFPTRASTPVTQQPSPTIAEIPTEEPEQPPEQAPEMTVSGALTQDETWSGDILLTGDVEVPAGLVLTIEPGTTVRFTAKSDDRHSGGTDDLADSERSSFPDQPPAVPADMISIVVEGTLKAIGTEDSPITFASDSDQPSSNDWQSIAVEAGGEAILDYVVVEDSYWGLQLNQIDSLASVTHSTFRHLAACAICTGDHPIAGPIVISESKFVDCRGGVDTYFDQGIVVKHNVFTENHYGVSASGASRVTIQDNLFYNNRDAITVHNGGNPSIVGNEIKQNAATGIWISGDSSAVISGNNIHQNGANVAMGESDKLQFAQRNWWGTADPDGIGESILDGNDVPGLGVVAFEPFAEDPYELDVPDG